jgi:hypothetical protein
MKLLLASEKIKEGSQTKLICLKCATYTDFSLINLFMLGLLWYIASDLSPNAVNAPRATLCLSLFFPTAFLLHTFKRQASYQFFIC